LDLAGIYCALLLAATLLLTGCGAGFDMPSAATPTSLNGIHGIAHGGKQPISGAHVYVYAAGTGGWGGASQSLLTAYSTGSYPTTEDANGNYYVTSGNTTSTQAQFGMANAFANATNLASLSSGTALLTTPAGNGTPPQTTVNTLGNILASCVNSADTVSGSTVTHSSGCSTLFGLATKDGTSTGTQPTDTATAVINIAHHPGSNVAALYQKEFWTMSESPRSPAYRDSFQTKPLVAGTMLSNA